MKMPREVIKALYGATLTFDEFLTIDTTALADLLKVSLLPRFPSRDALTPCCALQSDKAVAPQG